MRVHYLLPHDIGSQQQRRRGVSAVPGPNGPEVRFDLSDDVDPGSVAALPCRVVRLIATGPEARRLARYVWWGSPPERGAQIRTDTRRNLVANVRWYGESGLSAVVRPRSGLVLSEAAVHAIVAEAARASRTGTDIPDPIDALTALNGGSP